MELQDLIHSFIPKMIADIAPGIFLSNMVLWDLTLQRVSACASSANAMY